MPKTPNGVKAEQPIGLEKTSTDSVLAGHETLDNLTRAATVKMVYGEAVVHGSTIVIPAAEVLTAVGYGMGMGGRAAVAAVAADPSKNQGSGGGGWTVARPVGVIIISKDGVRVQPILDINKLVLRERLKTNLAGITKVGQACRMTKPKQPYPTNLNDTEWMLIEQYLPKAKPKGPGGRPRENTWRQILNGIFYISRSGCAWRMLPLDLPHWKTVYHYFRLWRKAGTWQTMNATLRRAVREQAGRQPEPSAAIMDSQSVKTMEGGTERGYDAGKKVTGRKRHLVVDTLGLVLLVVVTAANVQDVQGAQQVLQPLFDRIKKSTHSRWCRLKLIWADGGYRGQLIAWVKQTLGWTLQIVEKLPGQVGFQVLPKRWIVERTFAWLTRYRRLSRDYERIPATSEAFIYVAMIRLMTKRLARPT